MTPATFWKRFATIARRFRVLGGAVRAQHPDAPAMYCAVCPISEVANHLLAADALRYSSGHVTDAGAALKLPADFVYAVVDAADLNLRTLSGHSRNEPLGPAQRKRYARAARIRRKMFALMGRRRGL